MMVFVGIAVSAVWYEHAYHFRRYTHVSTATSKTNSNIAHLVHAHFLDIHHRPSTFQHKHKIPSMLLLLLFRSVHNAKHSFHFHWHTHFFPFSSDCVSFFGFEFFIFVCVDTAFFFFSKIKTFLRIVRNHLSPLSQSRTRAPIPIGIHIIHKRIQSVKPKPTHTHTLTLKLPHRWFGYFAFFSSSFSLRVCE